ncbi:tigger transposable element-derived protein 1-like [Condylostylus longicornis]|uniref:tigger transposable element-derived protein 1-like n=1 Tax=Condylostylus longicornis TaxID=2530218 RepID=UPI00244E12EB|nr:tigger transposable element-derived protein 1-like [Condylostylus longicornis]
MKPLLIYHSESPRALKGISKQTMPVIWMTNRKAWMTAILFKKWYQEHFRPAVKSYCERNGLEQKALLILDNAPGHPQNLSEVQTCLPVEIIFTPPNTTSILQLMDHGVIATFKAYYIRKTFKQLIEAVDNNECSIKEFWENYNIKKAIENIGSSRGEMQQSCFKGCWNRLLIKTIEDKIINKLPQVVTEITEIANNIGFEEVDEENIQELIESADHGISNEDLIDSLLQNQPNIEELTPETEDVTENILTKKYLENNLGIIQIALEDLCENDPNFESSCAIKRGVMNTLSPYIELLKEKRKLSKSYIIRSYYFWLEKVPKKVGSFNAVSVNAQLLGTHHER